IALAEQGKVRLDAVDLAGDRLRRLQQFLADGGEAQAFADAVEDLYRHPPLAVLDVVAEGRLGDAEGFRRPGEGAMPVDGHQHAQQLDVESRRHGEPLYEESS